MISWKPRKGLSILGHVVVTMEHNLSQITTKAAAIKLSLTVDFICKAQTLPERHKTT